MTDRPKPLYTGEHIEAWRNMIDRHLSIPHEFICFTDQPEQVPEGIRYEEIPDDTFLDYGGCFVRLAEFSPNVALNIIGGRFVDIDLDCVITDSLDPLLQRKEPMVVYKVASRGSWRIQGSIWMSDPAAFPELWEDFREEDLVYYKKRMRKKTIRQYINRYALEAGHNLGTDQSWLNYKVPQLEKKYNLTAGSWTFKDGIKNWGSASEQLSLETKPDDNTRIIFFSGPSDPNILKDKIPWIKQYYG